VGAADPRAPRDGCADDGRAASRGRLGHAFAVQAGARWLGLARVTSGRAASSLDLAELGRAAGIAGARVGWRLRRSAGACRAACRRPDLGIAFGCASRRRCSDLGVARASRAGLAPRIGTRAVVGSTGRPAGTGAGFASAGAGTRVGWRAGSAGSAGFGPGPGVGSTGSAI